MLDLDGSAGSAGSAKTDVDLRRVVAGDDRRVLGYELPLPDDPCSASTTSGAARGRGLQPERTGRTRTRAAGTWRWPGRRGWTTPWARWSGAWRGVDVHTAGRGTRRRMETRSVAPGRLGGPRGPAGGPAPAAGAGARRRGVRGHGVKVFIASILVVVLIQKFS